MTDTSPPVMSPAPGTPQTKTKAIVAASVATFLVALFGTPLGDIIFNPEIPLPTNWRVWLSAFAKTLLTLAGAYKLVDEIPNKPLPPSPPKKEDPK